MKKKLFTLLEVLFVVLIVSVLIYSLKNFFQMKDRDYIYGQSCLAGIYGEIRNFVDNAATGRGVYLSGSSNVLVDPDEYYIDLNSSQNSIGLYFSGVQSLSGVYKNIPLSGGNSFACAGPSYYVDLSGSNMLIKINKLLAGDLNNPPFQISGANMSNITGNIDFNYCMRDGTCKIMGVLGFDKRTMSVSLSKCMRWKKGGTECDIWSR